MCSWPKLPSTTMAGSGFSDSDRRGITNSHPNLFESKKSDKARVRVVKQEQSSTMKRRRYRRRYRYVWQGLKLGLTKRVS